MRKTKNTIKKIFSFEFWEDILAAILRPLVLPFTKNGRTQIKNRFFRLGKLMFGIIRHPKRNFFRLAKWCWATLPRRIVSSVLIALFVITPIYGILFAPKTEAAWWNDLWSYRKKITINKSQVAGELTNFPVLVSITDTNLISGAQADGDDLVFTDVDGNRLSHEIESYTAGTGALVAWVKLPHLTKAKDTPIYLYYGNASCSSQQDAANVWDSNFKMVQHMNQDPSGTAPQMLDSTANNNDGTSSGSMTSGDLVDAKVGKGIDFDGGDDYLQLSSSLGSYTNFTFSTWVYLRTVTNNAPFWGKDLNNRLMLRDTNEYMQLNGISKEAVITSSNIGSWVRIDVIKTDSITRYYRNGTEVTNWNVGSSAIGFASSYLGISGTYKLDGNLDEVQISNIARSPEWIVTEYANQNNPSAFLSVSGKVETSPGGPVGYWSFDEGQGVTAHDETPNKNDGTISGAAWKPESECVSGKCLWFDGTDDYAEVEDDDVFDVANAVTYEAWVRPNQLADGHIINKWVGMQEDKSLTFLSSGKFSFYLYNRFGGAPLVTDTVYEIDKWYHVAAVYDGTNAYVYVNGKEDGSKAASGDISDSTGKLYLGRNPGHSFPFKGSIDEPKIYPYARTAEQIKADYAAGLAGMGKAKTGASATFGGSSDKWMTEGLVGHWKMDETSGTSVADASGNGNTGTLTNAQETGTGEAAGTTTALVDADNAALSTADDAYNNMILRVTGGCSITAGTERVISDYTGSSKTIAVGTAFSAETDNCAFEIRHQAGGKFGSGMGFDGGNDYVDVANESNFDFERTSHFSMAAWVKYDTSGVSHYIYNKKPNSGYFPGIAWGIDVTNKRIKYYITQDKSGGSTGGSTAVNSLSSGVWHHVAMTYDGRSSLLGITCYIDGVVSAQDGTAVLDTTILNDEKVNFGRAVSSGVYLDGSLDEVRIYNRTLSPEEVQKLYEWAPGPVGHWKMDEKVSGNSQTLADSSGNGNNGTTNWGANASGMNCEKPGKFGTGCEFDGVDDYVSVAENSPVNISGAYTFSAWVKFDDFEGNSNPLISKGVGVSGDLPFLIGRTNAGGGLVGGKVRLNVIHQFNYYYTSWIFPYQEQFYLTVAWNGSQAKFYINGNLAETVNIGGRINADGGGFYLARGNVAWGTYYMDGSLDDVRIYNYARNQKQILADMEGGANGGSTSIGEVEPPVARYDFNEGVGATAHNSGLNCDDATKCVSTNGTLNAGAGGTNTTTTQMWDQNGKNGKAIELDGDDYISLPDFSY